MTTGDQRQYDCTVDAQGLTGERAQYGVGKKRWRSKEFAQACQASHYRTKHEQRYTGMTLSSL